MTVMPFSRLRTLVKPSIARWNSSTSPNTMSKAESQIHNKLHLALHPEELQVTDISGGCGSMYELRIKSNKFNGISKLQQQRLVNQVLKDEISSWHGVRMTTIPTE